jgi:hypothetical protein
MGAADHHHHLVIGVTRRETPKLCFFCSSLMTRVHNDTLRYFARRDEPSQCNQKLTGE